jgi:hypothetical protein
MKYSAVSVAPFNLAIVTGRTQTDYRSCGIMLRTGKYAIRLYLKWLGVHCVGEDHHDPCLVGVLLWFVGRASYINCQCDLISIGLHNHPEPPA